MQRLARLEDVTWAAGASRLINLDSLPAQKRVRKIHLFFDLSGTKDSADALDGQLFARAASLIKIGSYVNIPGWNLQNLMHQIHGRIIMDPTDIPGSGTTFTMRFVLVIPFRDPRQPGSDDGSIPTELLLSKALEVTFSADGVWGVGNLILTAGTLRAEAEIVDESAVPQLNVIGYDDPGSSTFSIRPGVYKDLFINDGVADGVITEAEIESVDLEVDGISVLNNALNEQLVSAYNVDVPKDAAAELALNAATRLPLIWHDQSGKANISRQPVVEKQGRCQLTGTITAPRLVYWRSVEKDQETIASVALATNAPEDSVVYEPSTASKSPLRASIRSDRIGRMTKKDRILTRVLAGKVREADEV